MTKLKLFEKDWALFFYFYVFTKSLKVFTKRLLRSYALNLNSITISLMPPCQYWITGDFYFLNRALTIPSHKGTDSLSVVSNSKIFFIRRRPRWTVDHISQQILPLHYFLLPSVWKYFDWVYTVCANKIIGLIEKTSIMMSKVN